MVLTGVTMTGHTVAGASTPTATLGTTTGTASDSACAAGDFAVGAHIWVEFRNYTIAIALWCQDPSGSTSLAPTAGSLWGSPTEADSMCDPGDTALGLYGRAGNVMDAIGIRCGGPSGSYDATLAGGPGGGPVGPADRPVGDVLTGVTAWWADYFGAPDIYGIQGACDPAPALPPPAPAVPPGAPVIGAATAAGNRSVSVSFSPGAPGSSPTTGYVASCQSSNAGLDGTAGGSGSPIGVPALTPGKTYSCSVFALNAAGRSAPSGVSNFVVLPGGTSTGATCTNTTVCQASVPTPSSAIAPAQRVTVTGIPNAAVGSVQLAPGPALSCPNVVATKTPTTTLTDQGFSAATNLAVTVAQQAVATGPGQMCFSSTTPFLSVTHPTVPTPGTAVLLACSAVGNQAPCQVSSTQTKTTIAVKFLVQGGDPDFKLVVANARVLWPSTFPVGKVGTAYAAHLQSSGGKAPVHWKTVSGKLAPGLTLNGSTGAITGTPKTKGTYSCEVRATDSEVPPKTANIAVTITIK